MWDWKWRASFYQESMVRTLMPIILSAAASPCPPSSAYEDQADDKIQGA